MRLRLSASVFAALAARAARAAIGIIAACAILTGCGSSKSGTHPARDLFFAVPPGNGTANTATGYTLTFTIGETSPVNAGVASVSWALTRDGAAFLSGTTGTVVANGTLMVTTPVSESVAGDHAYVLTIDSSNRITETDETNNTAEFIITWTSST